MEFVRIVAYTQPKVSIDAISILHKVIYPFCSIPTAFTEAKAAQSQKTALLCFDELLIKFVSSGSMILCRSVTNGSLVSGTGNGYLLAIVMAKKMIGI